MEVSVHGQPFGDESQVGTLLKSGLSDPRFTRLWLGVAWAKRSGISRIFNALKAFVERGGTAEAIIGIDVGGTTSEALQLASELFDPLYVYFDPGSRTFHPKFYVLENDKTALIVLGSNNLTKGGLFTNYELAVGITIDSAIEADRAVHEALRTYYESLKGAGTACQPFTDELLQNLLSDPRAPVVSEELANKRHKKRRLETAPTESLFGASVQDLAGAPAPDVAALPDEEADEDIAVVPAEAAEVEQEEAAEAPAGIIGFWKALRPTDVSHHSSPGQIIIPIGFSNFFPPLELQFDRSAEGGPRQSHAEFTLNFRDGAFQKAVETGRVILYEPAETHPRPNKELRFTFRDRGVFDRLEKEDVLIFTRENDGSIQVERRPPGSMGGGRFGQVGKA